MARKFLTPIDLNKLELRNAVIQNLGTEPENPVEGQIYYDTASDRLRIYAAGSWSDVGAVSSIFGTENEIVVSASVGAVTIGLPDTIYADVEGNASSASELETGRSIGLYGDVSGSVVFDGSADVNINATIQPNSVELGTDTTGNYVQGIQGTENEIVVTGSGGESASVTIGLPANVQIANDLTVGGALTVSGSTTFLNVETLTVEDNIVVLNSGATSAVLNAGIEVERGTVEDNVSIIWNETSDTWTLTNNGTDYHNITRKFAFDLGDNTNSAFNITHNLGTRDVVVNIYDSITYETVEADVVRTTADAVNITFAVAPGNNAYRVVISG